MSVFFSLLTKLLPLYIYILFGYAAGRILKIQRETLTQILFFFLSPIIIFNGIVHAHLNMRLLSIPILTFIISSILCIIFYRISRKIWADSSKNIMAFSAGAAATGYFGLPFALAIFNEETISVYILALMGVSLYENSLGYYISVKGSFPHSDCLIKLFKLPTIYALLSGFFFNLMQFKLPIFFEDFIFPIKGAYTVLGMMTIGLGLSNLKKFQFDIKFIGLTFFAKFLVYPLFMLALIALDLTFFKFYEHHVHQALILISIVPLTLNMVLLANLMDKQTEKSAFTVFLSLVFALFYVPFMSILFIL